MTETDLAWVAGLFDGEGSIHFSKDYRAVVSLGMTHYRTVLKLRKIVGFGSLMTTFKLDSHRRKYIYIWHVSNFYDCEKFLRLVLPFLECKKEEAIELLKLYDVLEEFKYLPNSEFNVFKEKCYNQLIYLKSQDYFNGVLSKEYTEEFKNYRRSKGKKSTYKKGHFLKTSCKICGKEIINSNIGNKTYNKLCSKKCITLIRIKCDLETLYKIREDYKIEKSCRKLGKKYGFSHEAIRRWVKKDENGDYII